MRLSRKQRIAITCVTLPMALLVAWFWNPFDNDAHGVEALPMTSGVTTSTSYQGAVAASAKRACPREDRCWPADHHRVLARNFASIDWARAQGSCPSQCARSSIGSTRRWWPTATPRLVVTGGTSRARARASCVVDATARSKSLSERPSAVSNQAGIAARGSTEMRKEGHSGVWYGLRARLHRWCTWWPQSGLVGRWSRRWRVPVQDVRRTRRLVLTCSSPINRCGER